MPSNERISRCRDKLIAVARERKTVPYGELARHIGVANQGLTPYLNAIYNEEMSSGRPDLTLVAVYLKTGFGRYNSEGAVAQSVIVDHRDAAQVAKYKQELARVYRHWGSRESRL
jgi:hypothetical protein